ncbi:hypothetical protein [Nonomuraea gerenzanensis]|uniref:PE-PGRS virulence associated protein n=1 Tax=Nonomuraea gerenzanensis TaxID=93944 RepID=A0A1M4E0H4_9ACTN|nr:hypothetical protein [Nonomuraea gerenzanensis]UBU14596.1 hypothetical protein LCN96_06095 [Nonomuraea gerenzanensis]SBO92313.1 PE-PGRS virulence associated protein [Nonomuraea gerenzanensis]
MADQPEIQTFSLRHGDQPIDTSVQEAGFMESMFRDTIGEIRDMIDATDPAAVQLAGLYYQAAEPLLNEFAADLKTKAAELAEHYKGPAAYQTQLQLRSLHASVVELAAKLGKMGRSLKPYGDTLQWAQANVVESRGRDSRSDDDIDWADQIPFYGIKRSSDRASQHLREVNERIAQHYEELPVDVQQALPIVVDPDMPNFGNTGLRGPQVGSLSAGDAPGYQSASFGSGSIPGGPSAGGYDGDYPSSAGQYPGGYGTGGLNPGDGTGGVGGVGGVGDSDAYGGPDPSGLTDNTLGATPGAPGVPSAASVPTAAAPRDYGSTNLAGYDPSQPGVPNGPNATTTYSGNGPGMGGTGGPGGGGTGNAGTVTGASTAAGAASAAGRAGLGGMGMPMMHAPVSARGRNEDSAGESTSNLYEDDDVWGGPEGTTPSTLV